jgi:hypothetical protein
MSRISKQIHSEKGKHPNVKYLFHHMIHVSVGTSISSSLRLFCYSYCVACILCGGETLLEAPEDGISRAFMLGTFLRTHIGAHAHMHIRTPRCAPRMPACTFTPQHSFPMSCAVGYFAGTVVLIDTAIYVCTSSGTGTTAKSEVGWFTLHARK